MVEIPFDLGTITQTMFWHPRTENEPGHRSLRARISALASGYEAREAAAGAPEAG